VSVREIVIWPHPALDTAAGRVKDFDENLTILAQDLVDTCEKVSGFGLAAPQLGVSQRIFVLDMSKISPQDHQGYVVFVNPTITSRTGERRMPEGCLSLPGVNEVVKRATEITLSYQNLQGEEETVDAEGVLAQAVQHEMDHLDGIVMANHLASFRRTQIRRKMEILKRRLRGKAIRYPLDIPSPEMEEDAA
jgi:peptide deformylase